MTSLVWCPANLSASSAGGVRLFCDCPDEARQLARDRGGDHGRQLSRPDKFAIPPTQPFLRLPRGVADRFGQTFLSQQLLAADSGWEPVAPGGLDQHPPRRAVPSLGD